MANKDLNIINQTTSITKNIESERRELKDRQKEINDVVAKLQKQVLDGIEPPDATKEGYSNFRAKPQRSVSEKMELIKAFVELQKLTVDINKTVIQTYEREFKMNVDLSKYLDTVSNTDDQSDVLTATDVIKVIKKTKGQTT